MQSFKPPRGFHQCLQMSYLYDLTQTQCLLVRTWDLLSDIAVELEDGLKMQEIMPFGVKLRFVHFFHNQSFMKIQYLKGGEAVTRPLLIFIDLKIVACCWKIGI